MMHNWQFNWPQERSGLGVKPPEIKKQAPLKLNPIEQLSNRSVNLIRRQRSQKLRDLWAEFVDGGIGFHRDR